MTGSTKVKRAAKRRRRRPYRQGDLDGLCGLYSTVNAMRVLCPEVDNEAAGALFAALMQGLNGAGAAAEDVVTGGVCRDQLARIVRQAIAHMADEHEIRLTLTRLPKVLRKRTDLPGLWGWLGKKVSPSCVALIGLAGRHSHWTVAVAVTPQQIRLFDSSHMGVLRRSQCTVGRAVDRHALPPTQIFLIRRRTAS